MEDSSWKKILCAAGFYSGLIPLLVSWSRLQGQGKVIILAYHRICEGRAAGLFFEDVVSASPAGFERQVKYLVENYNVISFDAFIEGVKGEKTLSKNSVIITFDDGYKDNYLNAYPILKKYNVPATIFLSTHHVDSAVPFWWDEVAYLISKTRRRQLSLSRLGEYGVENPSQKRKAINAIAGKLKELDEGQKRSAMSELATQAAVSVEEQTTKDAHLSWDEVREMSRNGISFGAHTVTHPILTKVPYEQARYEVAESVSRIQEEIEQAVRFFAYPNGAIGDFNEITRSILMENGIKAATTLVYGINNPGSGDVDLYALKRILITSDHFPTFLMKMSGILETPLRLIRRKPSIVLSTRGGLSSGEAG